MNTWLVCLIILGAFVALQRNASVRADFVRRHPPVAYVPPAAEMEDWRFGAPPLDIAVGMEKIDEPGVSRVVLPDTQMTSQTGASLFGWMLILISLAFVGSTVARSESAELAMWGYSMAIATFLMGWGLTYLDVAMQVIEFTPNSATFIGRRGFVFHQRVVFERRTDLHFMGETQSAWTMYKRQEVPNFVLTSSKGKSGKRRVLMMCTRAQGGWIRDALGYWAIGAPR